MFLTNFKGIVMGPKEEPTHAVRVMVILSCDAPIFVTSIAIFYQHSIVLTKGGIK